MTLGSHSKRSLMAKSLGVFLLATVAIVRPGHADVNSFDPPFPRLHAHKVGGWNSVDREQMEVLARHHTAALGLWRTWSADGYNRATLPAYIKSMNPDIKVLDSHPFVQTEYSGIGADKEIHEKMLRERGAGGRGDWYLRNADGSNIDGFSRSLWRINITPVVTPDSQGRNPGQWYFQWMYAKTSDGIDGVTKGLGLSEGDWDGIYEDDQFISYAFGRDADYDSDGRQDGRWDDDVRQWVMNGHKSYRDAMKAAEPNWIFMANMSSQITGEERVPESFQGLNDMGFFERINHHEYHHGWLGMMEIYRRGLDWLGGPKIGVFAVDIGTFREKYSSQPQAGFSDFRWNRYMLCSSLMEDGYYSVTATTYKDIFWADEHWGGSLRKVGYLGHPVEGPQRSPWFRGVYRREFDHGLVLVNPRGNGTQTVQIGPGWRRLAGQQDPRHNSGEVATVVTLEAQDGIILVRESVTAVPEPPKIIGVN